MKSKILFSVAVLAAVCVLIAASTPPFYVGKFSGDGTGITNIQSGLSPLFVYNSDKSSSGFIGVGSGAGATVSFGNGAGTLVQVLNDGNQTIYAPGRFKSPSVVADTLFSGNGSGLTNVSAQFLVGTPGTSSFILAGNGIVTNIFIYGSNASITISGTNTAGVQISTNTVGFVGRQDGLTNSSGQSIATQIANATPTATTSVLGLVKPDGTSITINSGVISSAGANIPSVLGGYFVIPNATGTGVKYMPITPTGSGGLPVNTEALVEDTIYGGATGMWISNIIFSIKGVNGSTTWGASGTNVIITIMSNGVATAMSLGYTNFGAATIPTNLYQPSMAFWVSNLSKLSFQINANATLPAVIYMDAKIVGYKN